MKLAGTVKLGYFPIHPEVISAILKHLAMPEKKADSIQLIDPCAGEGAALKQLADGLAIPPERTYAIELDAGRADRVRENIPGANVLGPASFLGCQITGYSFGMAYCNPPFDDELGGGKREEQSFVEKATRLLAPRGILVLVCPVTTLAGRSHNLVEHLDTAYENIRVFKFPQAHRHYREVVLFGCKRKAELPSMAIYQHGDLTRAGWQYSMYQDHPGQDGNLWEVGTRSEQWEVVGAWKPHTFKKIAYAAGELEQDLARSPLHGLLREVEVPPPARPPLPLNKGHVALLLASGMLDGVVEGPHGPHVVRGTAKKVEYISECSSTEDEESGAVTEKTIISQRIVLTIRATDQSGVIRTFSDGPPESASPEQEEVPEEMEVI